MLTVQDLGALELADPNSRNSRERHLAQILDYLREHGPSSRAQIAAECGLGISTMSELIGELRGRTLVSESDPVRTQAAGRPLREVQLDAGRWLVGGLHIEEDSVRGKLATLDGRELTALCQPLDASFDLRESITTAIAKLLADRPHGTELVGFEIGMPGAIQRSDGWVMYSQSLRLRDVSMATLVRAVLADLVDTPVAVGIDNDCNFAALAAHAAAGTAAPDGIVVYIGGSRGIGGSIVARDELLRGSHGAAGDFGHWTIDQDQTVCWCGRRGCLATRAELTTLLVEGGLMDEATAVERVARKPAQAVGALTTAAQAGDQRVLDVLTAAGDALGSVIDSVNAMVNPDQVLIGGYLGALGRFLEGGLRSRFRIGASIAPKESLQIRILDHDADAVVDGALVSAQRLCLAHPLHFTHGAALTA